jgi:hypothetical protein
MWLLIISHKKYTASEGTATENIQNVFARAIKFYLLMCIPQAQNIDKFFSTIFFV